MKKIAQYFFLFLFSTMVGINLFAQNSDFGPDSKSGVTANYGITQEESNWLNSKTVIPDVEIPQELLNQLEHARLNNDIEEANRINDIINSQYRTGVKIINSPNAPSNLPIPEPITGSVFPEEHDWLPGDVLVASDTGGGAQFSRTLDVKLGPDGNLYLASIVNTSTQRRINVYKSSDGGAVWTNKGGIWFSSPTAHFETLSMLVEDKSLGGADDSIRVIVYYTSAANDDNDGASLSYFQFKPNATNHEYILNSLSSPTTGREFNYVSAVSDGQYYTSLTYFGCVVGEFSNNADTTIAYRIFRTQDWGNTHSSVTLDIYASNYNDKYPMAQIKASPTGSDSVYIVSERVFSTYSEIRVTIAPWTLSTTFATNYLTTAGTGIYYKKPVLAIKQSPRSVDKRMVITCTKDGQAKYHYSLNSGDSWSTDLYLDTRGTPSTTTDFTYVTSDSTGSIGDFCAMFSQRNGSTINDSINVRRGAPGTGLGTTLYQQNSQGITSTHPPITAIYSDGGSLKSAFAYWANGPRGIYFDAENLVTDVSDLSGTVDKYELAQNYPNPFNPSTVIKFSVPEQANITLKIFNSIGQQVATLLNGEISAGNHQVDFNASALSSGIYFYQISSANFTATKKMILIK
ncbi:MAG: T9SS type A sorting domain-containing protein [Ignavibacteriota bacterium]